MKPYAALLAPILRPMPWGGEKLKKLPGAGDATGPVGEAWIMSDRRDVVSRIVNGPLAGADLSEYLRFFPDAIGAACSPGDFPLLVKLIDADDKLSVQVHPDDVYAKKVENDRGKCEAWYIIDAEPGSVIIAGLKEGADPRALTDGEFDETLFGKIFPEPGDFIFIPPGLVHSIGAGILLCEIQENSDLTYRIFDFGRKWGGVPRELHLQKAADCIVNYSNDDIEVLRFSGRASDDESVICSCDRFTIRKLVASADAPGVFRAKNDRFASLTVVSHGAAAELSAGDEVIPLSFGSTVFIPAGAGTVTVSGDAVFLVSEI